MNGVGDMPRVDTGGWRASVPKMWWWDCGWACECGCGCGWCWVSTVIFELSKSDEGGGAAAAEAEWSFEGGARSWSAVIAEEAEAAASV